MAREKKPAKVLWVCRHQEPDEFPAKAHGAIYSLGTRKADACIGDKCLQDNCPGPVAYVPRGKGD